MVLLVGGSKIIESEKCVGNISTSFANFFNEYVCPVKAALPANMT